MKARSRRRSALIGAIAAITLTAAIFFWPQVQRGYEGVLAAVDLAGLALPASLDRRPGATKENLHVRVGDRSYRLDIYRPQSRARAGLLLVHGAVPDGKDDPRLVDLALVLARARFAVLVPDVTDLRALRLLPDTARDIGDVFTYLISRPDLAPQGRAGIGAISVALGPTLLAALDSPVAENVRFVLGLGGYYDLPRTLTYLTTGYYDSAGQNHAAEPNEYGKWVFALSNASRLQGSADGQVLVELIRRKLRDRDAKIGDLVAKLGATGRAVYDYCNNRDPARAAELLERLPDTLRADIDALNLAARDLSQLRARLILVHGLGDKVIPYHESVQLAAAAPRERTRLFLIGGLHHVTTRPQLLDIWRMWQAVYALLAEQWRDLPATKQDS